MRGGVKGGILLVGGELQNLVACQHQFAHQVHQLVQQYHVHPDAGVRHRRTLGGSRLFGIGLFDIGSGCGRVRSRGAAVGLGAGGFQALAQVGEGLGAFAPGCFDGYQDGLDYIHGIQDQRDELGCELAFPVTQLTEEVLGQVGYGSQSSEAQEAASPFNGVDGTENTPQ